MAQIDRWIENNYKKLNVEIAKFRLNLLKKPTDKRKLNSRLKALLKSFSEVNKLYKDEKKD